jgi:predicted methyltransferase
VDAYHEFSHPFEMGRSIFEALKPGGQLVLIEYRAEDDAVPIKRLHKMTSRQVNKEMQVLGFELTKSIDVLPQQHFMVFTKPQAL